MVAKNVICGCKGHLIVLKTRVVVAKTVICGRQVPAVSEDYVYKSIIDAELHDKAAYQFR